VSMQRVRLFAGPNGSGKSTIKGVVPPALLGQYLNPDEIELRIARDGYYDLRGTGITTSRAEVVAFFEQHPLIRQTDAVDEVSAIQYIDKGFISFDDVDVNPYLSAVLTDFLRQAFIRNKTSFTFESVMSSPDKIQTLAQAQQEGFRTYLYYVATEDPLINLSRIRHRVRSGGHGVPEQKVIDRYYRSLGLLLDAVRVSHRAYVFDNSGAGSVWIAEVTNGMDLELKTDQVPAWVKQYLLDKI
jgi:predicted ABC-type ATPase